MEHPHPRAAGGTPRGSLPSFVAVLATAFGLVATACSPGDAAAAAATAARVTLRTGPTLAYLEQGPPDGPVVVLVHGYTDSAASFELVLPLLPPHLRVLAPDLRGHGDSSKTMPTHTVADFAADVVAFLDALHVERATIVGHSMGGLVAELLALERPERVERLVLVGTFVRGRNAATQTLADEVRRLQDPVDPAFVREFQRACTADPVPHHFFERVVAQTMKVPARVWQQACAGWIELDLSPRLPAITAPTLVLWGDRDAFAPREDQETLARSIPGAVLRTMPDLGHCPTWEDPAAVADAIAAFVAGPARAPAHGRTDDARR